MKSATILLFFLISPLALRAQSTVDTAALMTELYMIYERDQKPRTTGDSAQYMAFIDSTNTVRIEAIINKYGWPGVSFVGEDGNTTVWAVIQHAPLELEEKYYPLMQQSVEKGESSAKHLAFLEDRILMYKGQKQKYGTQISMNHKTGAPEVWPIADEKNVDVRRAKLGLESLEEYAKNFGIDYRLPVQ